MHTKLCGYVDCFEIAELLEWPQIRKQPKHETIRKWVNKTQDIFCYDIMQSLKLIPIRKNTHKYIFGEREREILETHISKY